MIFRSWLLTLSLILCMHAHAQDLNDLFSKESLVYYGVDLSQAVLIGDFGNGTPADLRDKMFPQWNEVIFTEKSKFNIRGAFRKTELIYDLVPVTIQNSQADVKNIFAAGPPRQFSIEQIREMVSSYSDGEKKEGLAVVFIVESLDKSHEKASVYVTVFDIARKQVLLTQLMKGTPGGIGLRNYWANAFHSIIEQIHNLKYGEWKKKYRSGKK